MLDKLDALAGRGEDVSGDSVLEVVVDLLAARAGGLRPEARDTLAALFGPILARASEKGCRKAAERLAGLPGVPTAILRELAWQPIEIAGPVLEANEGLCPRDLVAVIGSGSAAHARAVARRRTLPEKVTEAILLRGDEDALVAALVNRRARFAAGSLAALSQRAVDRAILRSALIQRSDLQPSMVDRLWPSLDGPGRARLIASGWRYSTMEVAEVDRETSAALVSSVRQGALPQSLGTYRTLLAEGQASLSEVLAEVVETDRLVETAGLIAGLHGLTSGVALNLLYGVYDRGVAVLARHVGLEDAILAQIGAARSRLPWVRSADPMRMVEAAADLSGPEVGALMSLLDGLWAAGVADTGSRRRFRIAA